MCKISQYCIFILFLEYNFITILLKKTVSIIGASGYSGSELTRLLQDHPDVQLEHLYAHGQAGKHVKEVYPYLEADFTYEQYDGQTGSDIYFLALPHGQALNLVPKLQAAGKMVIDLSGDFRIKSGALHEKYYKSPKPDNTIMQYGMPELFKSEIKTAKHISNPGCYATSIVLGLAPLLCHDELKNKVQNLTVCATSGLSGAGRASKVNLSFTEMSANMWAYKVGVHQHSPEIMQAFGYNLDEQPFPFTFVPSVAPFARGIYTTLSLQFTEALSKEEADELYQKFYQNEPFVRVQPSVPEIRAVAYTNYCDVHVGYAGEKGNLVVVSAIDNLLKGAAGQAIQNMNLMLGIDEETGLKPGYIGPIH